MPEKARILSISKVLGELISEYVHVALQAGQDYRLIVPGLTERISREVHEYLIGNGIKSYLVIGEHSQPSEEKQWISPLGLTSKRIGSFVAVVEPGQLALIQDSIRGSGGTIRSIAFSEEWPWIDCGSEAFLFDGPVLDRLTSTWTSRDDEKQWLRELILEGLVKKTLPSSWREELLLEEILGSFDHTLYPELDDIRKKLLFHAGIPCPSQEVPDVGDLVKKYSDLCQQIIERCQKEDDPRTHYRDVRVPEIIDERQQDIVKKSLDVLFDGIGISKTLNLGLLAFYSCWGKGAEGINNWRTLHYDLLAKLFDIKEGPKAEVSYKLECNRGVVSTDYKAVATFVGEQLNISVDFKIPQEQFVEDTWLLALMLRGQFLFKQPIQAPVGNSKFELNTSELESRSARKLPLRLVLICGEDIRADARIALNLCGRKRPAFVVVEPGFDIIDALDRESGEEPEVPDKKIEISEPVQIYLFQDSDDPPEVRDGEDNPVRIGTEAAGIWRTTERVDPTIEKSGIAIRACIFGERIAIICFEAKDIEKGEFTIEDELRVLLSGRRDGRLKEVASLFAGDSRDPYPFLGKLNDPARRRVTLAREMTGPLGWKPLLTNLLSPDHGIAGSFGDYVNYLGNVPGEAFNGLMLPEDALVYLRAYSDARDVVRKAIEENLETRPFQIEHPVYASNPIFNAKKSKEIEELILRYMKCYLDILAYMEQRHHYLEWRHLFILTHLDCAVHWEEGMLRDALMLIGPWHPLILSKRFMVQAALFARYQRLSRDKDNNFRQLVALLERVNGFRWIPGLSAMDKSFEPTYVSATSDPGWHLAVKKTIGEVASRAVAGNLQEICNLLKANFGLDSDIMPEGADDLVSSCIGSYLRAFPSRRAVGIRVSRGYYLPRILSAIDKFLHSDDGPTAIGSQLPGGIRIFLQEALGDIEEINWFNPPIQVFEYNDDQQCIKEESPDIYVIPPDQSVTFRPTRETHRLPRAKGCETVFYEPLVWLTEGQQLVPNSITYELDQEATGPGESSLGELFVAITSKAIKLIEESPTVVRAVKLPQQLDCPWAITPGRGLDPSIFVKYVRDGMARAIQNRALWDYKVDLAGQNNSYYILSTIPRSFQVSVSGIFGREDVASAFIEELGKIGIAIGGEALKSGRHALGVVGLIGAVRLFLGQGGEGNTPLKNDSESIGFLIPVDSFASFFGHATEDPEQPAKRTDLLAIQLYLPKLPDDKILISACGVESKFVSGTYSQAASRLALEQARSTLQDFQALVKLSLQEGSVPERLGLLSLLKFGLRISSPSTPREISDWIGIERMIYEAVLLKRYEYRAAKHEAVLVTTEMGLPGVAEANVISGGLWIRLNRDNWPGISDTPKLKEIRKELSGLFMPGSDLEDRRDLNSRSGGGPSEVSQAPETVSGGIQPAIQVSSNENGTKIQVANVPLRKIMIGVDDGRRIVYFDPHSPVERLENLNMMVTGSSGTGKTQFVKYLICQLRQQEKNIIILDFKNDFASDDVFTRLARLERVFINFEGLPFNPLIPYPMKHQKTGALLLQCGQHISGVVSILQKTYGLGPQQQATVKNAIVAEFSRMGIPTYGSVPYDKSLHFPDFHSIGERIRTDNPAAYNRLDPLFTLELFRNEFREVSFESLVERSVVLDLSHLPSEQLKNALAQLIVMSAHSYYNSIPHSGTIRQIFVFDEAHRVLESNYMLMLARECRAYGVGIILSSQFPRDFPPEISASMATKVIHGNGRDIEMVRAMVRMIGCEGQEAEASSLEPFQAFVDNRHYPHKIIRTMNYPLFLVLTHLRERGNLAIDEIHKIEGLDLSKLPVENLVAQLERLGLVEKRDGIIRIIDRD